MAAGRNGARPQWGEVVALGSADASNEPAMNDGVRRPNAVLRLWILRHVRNWSSDVLGANRRPLVYRTSSASAVQDGGRQVGAAGAEDSLAFVRRRQEAG